MNSTRPTAALAALLRPALVLFLLLSVLTGLVYPLLVTAAGAGAVSAPGRRQPRACATATRSARRSSARPSAIPKHFWSRPSATTPQPYNGTASSGSNLGPLNPALTDAVKARVAALRRADPGNTAPVPVDLVTASASGLDPDISVAAARLPGGARRPRARSRPGAGAGIDCRAHARVGWPEFSASRASMCCELNLALDALK